MTDFDRTTHNPWAAGPARSRTVDVDQGLRGYMLGIYNHMTIGLAVSTLVAMAIVMMGRSNPVVQALYGSPLRWVVMLAPLAFVLVLSWRFERMSYTAVLGTFWAFAAMMGLSLGSIGLVFKVGSIVQALLVTTIAFGGLSLYGYTTKRSLSAMGSFLVMGVIGLMVAGIVNIVLGSSVLAFAISAIGLVIFAGLTAWDTQRLKQDYADLPAGGDVMAKASVMGALTLYLNFINMFQFILSLTGSREE